MARKKKLAELRAPKNQEAFDREEMGPDVDKPMTLTEKQKKAIVSMFEDDNDLVASMQNLSRKRSEMFALGKTQHGFDPARLKAAFARARMSPEKRLLAEEVEDLYFAALPATAGEDFGEGEDGED